MSDIFGAYAQYYDLLYKDKNYSSEVDFIEQILNQHAPSATDMLELGCGTGAHAMLLAEKGYRIHGIDISEEMLEVARRRAAELSAERQRQLSFSQGNARNYQVDRQFDAVLSLFHVVSYQSTNIDLYSMFKNVALHIKPGGIFIFDYWYGPAVLTDRPATRIKRMSSDIVNITRLAEPKMDVQTSCVDVNYQVMVYNKKTQAMTEFVETHRMRYLFLTEIDMLAKMAGLTLLTSGEWLTGRQPSKNTWGVYSVLRK